MKEPAGALGGHRVKKESYTSGSLAKTEYYVRDASGSVMAIYQGTSAKEYPIYGGSRLGVYFKSGSTAVYQLTDHLGNVRALLQESGTLAGATDYYPGGMAMPARKLSDAEGYRYGYQGEFAETDAETGKPAFELRLYDPRINRWLSPDPMGEFYSPYLAMGNNWGNTVDPTGGQTDCEDCPVPTIHLDEVVVTVSRTNNSWNWTSEIMSPYSGPFSNWMNEFGNEFGFSGSFTEVDAQYRARFGNSYKEPRYNALANVDVEAFIAGWNAGALSWEEGSVGSDLMLISSTLIGNTLLATAPMGGAGVTDDVVAGATWVDRGLARVGTKMHFAGNTGFNVAKRRIINIASKPLKNMSFTQKRAFVRMGGNNLKDKVQAFAKYEHDIMNYQTFKQTQDIHQFAKYVKQFFIH